MRSIERKSMLLDTGGPDNGPIFKLEFIVDGTAKSAEIRPGINLKREYLQDPKRFVFAALEEIFDYKIENHSMSREPHEWKGTVSVVVSSNGSRHEGHASFDDPIRILEAYSDAYVNAVLKVEPAIRSA
ncbi:hypothetical protein HYX08_04775 [Candidatus Woesearchaeota archaeon]|nr:hypothetical protein [Candidatus Woesearchaeota archaeon]